METNTKNIIMGIFGVVIIALAVFCVIHRNKVSSASEPGQVGADRDEHGCIGSAGYSWCEAKSKCLRVWEEPCS